MPRRFISDSCRTSANLNRVSSDAERLFWRLVSVADDYGRFEAAPAVVKANAVPLLRWAESKVMTLMRELAEQKLIAVYPAGDKAVGLFRTWERYQGPPRAKRSRFADPSEFICAQLHADVLVSVFVFASVSASDLSSACAEVGGAVIELPGGGKTPAASEGGSSGEQPLSPDELAEAWNEICVPLGLARVMEVRGSRREKATRRLREHPALGYWRGVFSAIKSQGFLLGKGKGSWRASFDWLVENDVNATKVIEGRYAA